jgi:hypothetical protein
MRVILQVTSGPSLGRRIPLQVGEIARFGSHDTADVCFPDDAEMSDVHFELQCHADRCVLRDLSGSGATFLNDEPVSQADLNSGDVIQAGQTSLSTSIQGGPSRTDAEEASESDASAEDGPAEEPLTAAKICSLLDLSEESEQLLLPEHTPEAFINTLVEQKQFADAISVLAFYLPKHQAVEWAYRCVQELLGDELSSDEQAVMKVSQQWLDEPTEEHRRVAMTTAEKNEFQSIPCWVALAAFWSDGSLAPPDLPEVKPDERLTSQGVSAALLMTATHGDPTKSDERYQQILETGQEILSSASPLPA